MGRGRVNELEGCPKCIQILVLVFNLIFFILGAVILGFGVYTFLKIGDYASLSTVEFMTASRLFIGLGTIIVVVSFCGCCGAWKLSKCLLVMFFVLLLIIFGVEIAAAVLGYLKRNEVEDTLQNDLLKALQGQYGESDQVGITKAFNTLQEKEQCCGVMNYTDWEKAKLYNGNHSVVPDSCCREMKAGCGNFAPGFVDKSKVWTKGCFSTMKDLIVTNLPLVAGVVIGVLVIQLLGMIFSMVLICAVNKNAEYA